MTVLGGFVAEILASIGAIAAGGAFLGTAWGLVIARRSRLERSDAVNTVADAAAEMSMMAMVLALLEEVIR